MAETGRQYTRRILSNLGTKDPMKVLSATPGKLERLLRGVSQARGRKRPGKGKWSIAEIVSHLAETEVVLGYRMRLVASRNRVRIQVMDQNAWVQGGHYNNRPLRQSVEHFRSARKANLDFLKGLSRPQWNNYGRHPERGNETIRHMARMYAGHDVNHLQQIAGLLKTGKRR